METVFWPMICCLECSGLQRPPQGSISLTARDSIVMFQVHIEHHLDVYEKVYMPEYEATDEPKSELIHS